jgi:hypothetical protein
MFSRAFNYPYEEFRKDLRAMPTIIAQKKIRRLSGEVWDAEDFEGGVGELGMKIASYFLQRYSDHSQVMEFSGVLQMTVHMIAEHIDAFAPGHDINELAEHGFDQAAEPLLRAIHALHTEVDLFEWGDDDDATFEFIVEMAHARFGYEK